ncbi:RNA methyltransferase [Candidatus Gottesmanbacteria bacterium]|nr:RNA methyltransferase [Candidatus Gottesmanbacteria bacterium]
MNERRISRITKVVENRQRDIVVVLEDIHDPHNAAAILRTCDAMGIQHVWYIFEKEKRYNPKRIGKATSSSANKWLDFALFDTTRECIDVLKKDGYTIMVTALTDNAVSLLGKKFDEEKIAVIVGNEHSGVSEAALTAADTVLQIPMLGFVQSLNVSVAAAMVLWEITRQRNGKYTLRPKEKQKLLDDFLDRAKK